MPRQYTHEDWEQTSVAKPAVTTKQLPQRWPDPIVMAGDVHVSESFALMLI